MRLRRGQCAVMLLVFLYATSVYGTVPTFVGTPCAEDIVQGPDTGANVATVFWAIPLANVGSTPAAVTCDRSPGETYEGGDNTVSCTAKDVNVPTDTAPCTFRIRVYPTFQTACPADFPFGDGNAVTFVKPVANLDIDGAAAPTVTCDNLATFPAGSTTVTCTAPGAGSRSVSCSFEVTIGTLPTFATEGSCAAGSNVINVAPDAGENTASNIVAWTAPTTTTAGATLACDPDPADANTKFEGGDTTVTCKAEITANPKLLVSCTVEVRVYPTFVTGCPDNIAAANGAAVTVTPPAVNADSNGDAVTAGCLPTTYNDDTVTDVTCTATDDTLTTQEATCSLKVTRGTLPTFATDGSCADPAVVDVVPDAGGMTVPNILGEWTKPAPTDATQTVTCEPDPDTTKFEGGETTVTCSLPDATIPTLINTCSFKVRVFPQFAENSCGADVIRSPDPDHYQATYAWINAATDKDGGDVAVTCTPASGSKFSGGENDVTCTATQAGSEDSTCSFKVTVLPNLDITTLVADIKQAPDADSNKAASVTWTKPTIKDASDTDLDVVCTPDVGSSFNGGSTPVECYGEDPISNLQAVNQFTVSIWPNMPDSELVPDIKRAPDPDSNVAAVTWDAPTATGSDNSQVTATCEPASGTEFSGGLTDVVCTATDPVEAGLTVTNKFTVGIYPTFAESCADFRADPDTTGETTTVAYGKPTSALDSQGAAATVTCVPDAGTGFPNDKETEVTCFAVDSDTTNFPTKAICSLTVTVGEVPTFNENAGCPDDQRTAPTAGKNVAEGVTWTVPSATQSDGNPATVSCLPAVGSDFEGGTNTVRCTAVDSRMPTLTTSCSFNVHVFPTFANPCVDQAFTPTDGSGTTDVNYVKPVGAADSTNTAAAVTCDPDTGTSFTNDEATDVTCTATDADATNYPETATCTFKVVVAAAPVFDADPPCSDENASPGETGNGYSAVVTWVERTAKLGDGVNDAAVQCVPSSGSTFGPGDTNVRCTAVDPRWDALSTDCPFKVRVYPTFKSSCEDREFNKGTTGTTTVVNYVEPVANTDSTGANPSVSCTPATDAAFANDQATEVVCTAQDSAPGDFPNAACTFQVKVGTAPTFDNTCPSNKVVAPDASGEAVVTWDPITANPDSSGNPASVQCDYESGATFNETTLVTCTATDAGSKRTSQCSFKVIIDSVAPQILCPNNPDPVQAEGSNQAAVTWTDPTVGYDDADPARPVSVTCIPKSGSMFTYGTTTVYCSAIDIVDNVGQCSFEVVVTGPDCSPVCAGESDCTLDTDGTAKCVCQDGYSSATDDGVDCQNVDECTANPCHDNADCTDETPGYNCTCKEGFYGDGVFSCDQYETEYPDIDISVEKKFKVEIEIADASAGAEGANCDPDVDKESSECVALVNTFKLQVEPMYRSLSNSFIEVLVVQSEIRKGSVFVPHTVSYDYATASNNIRGLGASQFYADTVEAAVDKGQIGSLQVNSDYKSVQETTDFCTDAIKEAMTCPNALSVYEDRTDSGCRLECRSKCSTETTFCNGGTCTHDATAGETCRCPDNLEGDRCQDEKINIPLIVGLSVGLGGGALLIIVCLLIYCLCCRNKDTKVNSDNTQDEEGGRSNEAMSMEGR